MININWPWTKRPMYTLADVRTYREDIERMQFIRDRIKNADPLDPLCKEYENKIHVMLEMLERILENI